MQTLAIQLISDSLKLIHTSKQSPRSGDSAEQKKATELHQTFSGPNMLEKSGLVYETTGEGSFDCEVLFYLDLLQVYRYTLSL